MTKHKEALEALGRMRPTNNIVQSYMDDWHIVKNYLQAASWQRGKLEEEIGMLYRVLENAEKLLQQAAKNHGDKKLSDDWYGDWEIYRDYDSMATVKKKFYTAAPVDGG